MLDAGLRNPEVRDHMSEVTRWINSTPPREVSVLRVAVVVPTTESKKQVLAAASTSSPL